LEEARRTAEVCASATAAQFGSELRLRGAAHEQTLEAVVARYVEKETARQAESARIENPLGKLPRYRERPGRKSQL